jgi:DNA-binding beta-propeller fold protein YncE
MLQSATPRPVAETATPVPTGLTGYVFNARTQDVTLFDPVTRQVLETRPLGAVVRWLSNEQRFWDGQSIWTYDFPDDEVRAIALDPREIAVSRALPTGGAGPAHSLMLTPDHKTAWVNVAGGNALAVIDLASGEVTDEIATGTFP